MIARLERGDITSAQLRGVARLARQFSDGTVRLTNEQNLVFRFVPEASLTALHAELVALGLGRAGRAHHPRRDLVPGRRHLQPGGDALARAGDRRRRTRSAQRRARPPRR